ncbi:MAG: iron ABC transporter permease [Peptoniphilus sp.]|nr:iron ABC transporter permease [Peptoniphilus sp.]
MNKKEKILDTLFALLIFLILVMPFVKLIEVSLYSDGFTLSHFKDVFSDFRVATAFKNTLIVGIFSSLICALLGSLLAFLIAYTDVSFKGLIKGLVYLPFIVPSYVITLSYTNITSNVGFITYILKKLGLPLINLYSIKGIIFVMVLCYTPMVYLMVMRNLLKIPRDMEYSSRLLGYSLFETMRNINLKQIFPTIASGFFLVFLSTLDNFSIPAFLGVPAGISVLSTLIYEKAIGIGTGAFSQAASLSVVLLLMALVISSLENQILNSSKISKDAHENNDVRIELKHKKSWGLLVVLILFVFNLIPIGSMIYSSFLTGYVKEFSFDALSFDNYLILLSTDTVKRAVINSTKYSILTVIICAVISVIYGYLKWKNKFKISTNILDKVSNISYSIPGMVLSLGMIFHWAKPLGFSSLSIYGTGAILIVAYVSRFVIINMKSVTGGFLTMSYSLEESAILSNPSHVKKWTYIIIPMIIKYVLTSSLMIFSYSFRELTLSALLSGPKTTTIGLSVYNLQQAGNYYMSYAFSTLILIVLFAMYLLLGIIDRRKNA